jgi:DMSO/TMAO reductase YedYZ molybdopterin-dependent catalytic subunit
VPLAEILSRAGVRPEARFVVFHCADTLDDGETSVDPESTFYYESIDLIDAVHPQTILAYDMNGKPLTVPHGAPLGLRLERRLGY